METLTSFMHALSDLTPLGLAGLCAILVYGLLSKNSPIRQMKENHLSHMQVALETLVEQGKTQIEALDSIKVDIAVVKDRLPRK